MLMIIQVYIKNIQQVLPAQILKIQNYNEITKYEYWSLNNIKQENIDFDINLINEVNEDLIYRFYKKAR